jgi:glycine/D-amino acid oxidase-like deaminating enzyme
LEKLQRELGAAVLGQQIFGTATCCSGRNGGHVNNGTSVDFDGLAQRLGLDQARSIYRAYDAAVDTVQRIVREEQITCAFRRGGKIKLAAKPQHYEKIARGFEILNREADPDTDMVTPENT